MNSIVAREVGKKYQLGRAFNSDLRNSLTGIFKRKKSVFPGKSDFWALEDISFEIACGEAVGIIGRNGAGKSTLLKILSRITRPSVGRVELIGRVGSLLEVGTGFHPELTGKENVYLNGTILGMKRREVKEKLEEIVEFSGVSKFIDTSIKHYSSGMKVRLAFSVAAHLEPEILLIDEVLAVGDVEFQKKCLGKMEDVTKEGRTVLFVSHQMEAIRKFCKRCFLLDKGKLTYDDVNVDSVIQSYISSSSSESQRPEWINVNGDIHNPIFIPKEISVYSKGIKARGAISNSLNNEVVIMGEVLDDNPFLEIGYMVYNQAGILVYTTFFHDNPEDKWPKIKRGSLELRSEIPCRYLNEGIYKIEVIVGIRKKEWYIGPGASEVSLYFEIQGGLSDSPIWHTKRQGVTAPVIKWYN